MTRRNKSTRCAGPADRLARLLLEAAVAAYAARCPSSAPPAGWAECSLMGRAGYRAVAEEMLRRGVKLPLEDRPEVVEWVNYEDYCI